MTIMAVADLVRRLAVSWSTMACRAAPTGALALLLCLNGCDDGCANTVAQRLDSPDGFMTAVLYQRDCGATTGYSSQISVLRSGDEPSGSGNAFVADADHGAARVAAWGGPWVEMKWLAPQRLRIRYDGKARLFRSDESVKGVSIRYEKVRR